MQIRDYQQWLEAWNHAWGWQRVSPLHAPNRALEVSGEVARLILPWEGYRQARARKSCMPGWRQNYPSLT